MCVCVLLGRVSRVSPRGTCGVGGECCYCLLCAVRGRGCAERRKKEKKKTEEKNKSEHKKCKNTTMITIHEVS